MIKLRTILRYNRLYKIIAISTLILALIFTNLSLKISSFKGSEKKIDGIIDKIKIDGNQLTLEVIAKEKIIVYYWFNNKIEKDHFNLILGDKIAITGELIKPRQNTVFNLFNYQKYLYNQGINYLFNANKIEKLKTNKKISYHIKNLILNRINHYPKSKAYLLTFLLGDYQKIDAQTMNSYRQNGINHLFAISGMHVSFLALTLLSFLKIFNLSSQKRYLLVLIFLFFYLFLTNYAPSVWRATLFFTLQTINNNYYFKIKAIDILLITLTLLLVGNPYLIYNIGFQYSFIISFFLIIASSLFNKQKNYYFKIFIMSIIAFLSSIPITSYYFFQINLLSPFFNLFFIPLVTFILFPLSLIAFFIPLLDSLLFFFVMIMEKGSLLIDQIKIGVLLLAKPNFSLILAYYLIISLGIYFYPLKKRFYFSLIILLLLFHYHLNYFNFKTTIDFIDVGQGDAILITLPHQKGSILIDTGGILNYPKEKWQLKKEIYSLGKNTLIPYFKSIGLKKINYLILTHGDYDHMGEALTLIENFKIDKVILNEGEENNLKSNIITSLIKHQIPYQKALANDYFIIDKYQFMFLNPTINHYDENDNSLVLYTILNKIKVLLMADASTNIEKRILSAYNLKEVDILKIGHHGSITSTCDEFLDVLTPKYAVIQVGLNNSYHHPHPDIINRLKIRNIKTFLTSVDGSIKFSISKNKVTIIKALP